MSRRDQSSQPWKSILWQMLVLCFPLLIIALGLGIATQFFGGKSTRLERAGVAVTAEVYQVTRDRVGEVVEAYVQQHNRRHNYREGSGHWTIHYRFLTADASQVSGSYNVQSDKEPSLGRTFDVRYLPSDPSVHETAIGHTASQAEALRWIALVFSAIWVVVIIGSIFGRHLPRRMSITERRKRRLDVLKERQAEKESHFGD